MIVSVSAIPEYPLDLASTTSCRDGQSNKIWSQLQFDAWSFDGSDQLLEILRRSFISNWLLEIGDMELKLWLALILLELL